MQAFVQYILDHPVLDGRGTVDAPVPNRDLKLGQLTAEGAFFDVEAAALSDLRHNWADVDWKKMPPNGLLVVVKWYGWHFTIWDCQKPAYKAQVRVPPCERFYGIHLDFGQSRTLPVGPNENAKF